MSIEEIQDIIREGISWDFENGVAWMNDLAAEEFKKQYPKIWESLITILDIETDELEDDVIQH